MQGLLQESKEAWSGGSFCLDGEGKEEERRRSFSEPSQTERSTQLRWSVSDALLARTLEPPLDGLRPRSAAQ